MIPLRETYLEYSNSPAENSCHRFLTLKRMHLALLSHTPSFN